MIERNTNRSVAGDVALAGVTIASMYAAGAIVHKRTDSFLMSLLAALLAPVGVVLAIVMYIGAWITWAGLSRQTRVIEEGK